MSVLKSQKITKNINIIGAGASGMYTCFKLLQLNKLSPAEKQFKLNINIWDKLPVPFGLVRSGVAPDHPEIKNCIDTFKEIFTDKSLCQDNNVKFVGNYNFTKKEEYEELIAKSDLLYLANGCEKSRDYQLENKTDLNTLKAKDLVNWYNNYPESKNVSQAWKSKEFWSKIKHINIVGNGNVAFDICRLLTMCKYDKETINKSDINEDFVKIINNAPLKKINIIGRRDFESARFGTKEFRELWGLSKYGVTGYINPKYYDHDMNKKPSRALAKKIQLTKKHSTDADNGEMKLELKFLQSPFKIDNEGKKLYSKENVMDADNSSRAIPTDKIIDADNDLVILSIGTENPQLKDYEQLIAKNPNKIKSVGWLKNKGFGTIANTMLDTFALVDKDYKNLDMSSNQNSNELQDFEFLRHNDRRLVSWGDYEKIEHYEQHVKNGKKCESLEEIMSVIGSRV